MYARDPLQLPQYSEQIAGARIARWAKHAHEALGRRSRGFSERFEPDGGVDVIAQDRLAGLEVPGQELFGGFRAPRFKPHIYTDDELRRLLNAIPICLNPPRKLEPHTLRSILLLLYGAGLRIERSWR
jgi:hypothetical protein